MVSSVEQLDTRIDDSIKARESKRTSSGGNTDTEQTEKRKETRGRPRKQPAAAAEAETKFPRMVDVEVPSPEEPSPTPKKPRPKKSTSSAKKIGVTSENVSSIIKACGDIVGNREGFELWKLDDKECQQIADPLSKIIARSEYLERITEQYGDYIALMIATSTVIIPRMMIQASMNKEKKINELEKQKEKKEHAARTRTLRNEGNENRTIGNSHREFNEPTPNGNQTINPEFHKSIPTIQG